MTDNSLCPAATLQILEEWEGGATTTKTDRKNRETPWITDEEKEGNGGNLKRCFGRKNDASSSILASNSRLA